MAVYVMENKYSLRTVEEFVYYIIATDKLKKYPLNIKVKSINNNKINVRVQN